MREIVTKGARAREVAILIVIAVAGAVLMIAMSFVLLPLVLYRRVPLHHSPRSKVRLQGPVIKQRLRTESKASSIMHHQV